jgi:hypothetical protein
MRMRQKNSIYKFFTLDNIVKEGLGQDIVYIVIEVES